MKVYSSSDVAEHLKIKTATLRKYCIMLEEEGYTFKRNSRNHRYFSDKDVMTLQNLLRAKNNGITLEEAIQGVVYQDNNNSVTNDIHNAESRNDSDIEELKTLVYKQNELIAELSKRMDKQQEYIDKRLIERDQVLLQRLDQSLEEQKRLATAEEKKSFFGRLFNK